MLKNLGYLTLLLALNACSCDDDNGKDKDVPDSGVDGDDDGGGEDAGPDGEAPDLVDVALDDDLDNTDRLVYFEPDVDLPRISVRLTPPALPFTVHEIVYRLADHTFEDVMCDATLEHGVALAQAPSNTEAPPDVGDEDVVVEINDETDGVTRTETTVDGMTVQDIGAVEFRVVLDQPYEVTEGNDLYVVIHMNVAEPLATCAFAGTGSVATRDNNHANDALEGVTWTQLRDYLVPKADADLQIIARGVAE